MPQVPGNTIPGAGGYGSYPGHHYRDRYDWLYSWGTVVAGGSVGLTAVGKTYRMIGLTTRSSRFLWGLLVSTAPGVSPGGGGPGQSLTSTNPPPSVTEVGWMMTTGRHPDQSRKCPPGKIPVWSHRKKRYVCMKIPEKGWRDFSRKYD